jgi:predicted dehydrogenase
MIQSKNLTPPRRINRRRFLTKAANLTTAAIFPYVVSSSALGKAGAVAPSNRLTAACIGVGDQGTWVMRDFLSEKDVHVAAVCDVKAGTLEAARDRVNEHYQADGCATYSDFRELLARDDIDIVSIATPDHWHVPIALAAAKAGKHIYLEKPLGLSLAQDQALRDAVHRYETIFQFGTQQRSSSQFRLACELARNGRIGKLHTVNVWAPGSVPGGSAKPVPVPEGLDYDRWLGPATFTPYTENKCSPDGTKKTWWFISDYTLGFISGWGVHPLDIAVWGGGPELTGPVEVEGTAEFSTEGICDTATDWDVIFTYSSGVKIRYTAVPIENNADAVYNNKAWEHRYGRTTSHGTVFEGTEGWVHVDRHGINAHPRMLLDSPIKPDELHLCRSYNHVRNLLDCVKTGAQTVCPIDEAVRADTLCHLSDIAIRLSRKLKWDPAAECFINDQQANRMLKRAMRSPWHL